MANETELGNVVHKTDVVAAKMTASFTEKDSIFPLIMTESFPDDTNVIKFAKAGKVEGGGQAESTAYSFGADDEVTDTKTTVTGVKKSSAQKITIENGRFGGSFASMQRYINESAMGLNRVAATEFKALIPAIANEVVATTTLTKDDILDGRYSVTSSMKSASVSPKLFGMFDYKGMNELAKELTSVSASAFVSQIDLGLLGMAQAGTPKGELFDVVLFETSGLPTNTGDDEGLIWAPEAFCAGVDGNQGFQATITEPKALTPWTELFFWTFWHIAEHNDTAACRVRSDS